MDSRVALDTDALRKVVASLSNAAASAPDDDETLALVRIYFYITNPLVVPTVSEEIEAAADAVAVRWRDFQFTEVSRDDYFRGCVKGKTETYLGYHPDPRDCHAVAEAECAKVEAFLTTNNTLLKGLGGRSETISVRSPVEYWRRVQPPRGASPRIVPASANPLGCVNWWRW